MSKITESDVKQIAVLARLELSAADITKYQSELSHILDYVDLIGEVKTDDVVPTAQVTGLTDVTRDDIKVPSELTRDEILENAPDTQGGYIKVKSVLG
jgi:aspartyl-tRNA(Asn)/glutamyl-tRNA(Gln) amidotransferase subunit C